MIEGAEEVAYEYDNDGDDAVLWINHLTKSGGFAVVRKYRKVIGVGDSLFIRNDVGRFGEGWFRHCE